MVIVVVAAAAVVISARMCEVRQSGYAHSKQPAGDGHRTTLQSQVFPSIPPWVLGVEFGSSGLHHLAASALTH